MGGESKPLHRTVSEDARNPVVSYEKRKIKNFLVLHLTPYPTYFFYVETRESVAP